MKERPILMTPENAQKCHEGSKTQTRRIVKPTKNHEVDPLGIYDSVPGDLLACPYGVVGDRLWVREPWEQVHPLQAEGRFSIPGRAGIPGPPGVEYRVIYRGQGEYPRLHFQEGECEYPYRELCLPGCQRSHVNLHPEESWHGWTPSIHMPRWACRTVLEISEVRVERLHEITEDDAVKEGVMLTGRCIDKPDGLSYVAAFRTLWESINGPGSWALNPWVWVISFQRVN